MPPCATLLAVTEPQQSPPRAQLSVLQRLQSVPMSPGHTVPSAISFLQMFMRSAGFSPAMPVWR